MTTDAAAPYTVTTDGNRHVYRLTIDHGPFAHWPVASMRLSNLCTHVALSRSFLPGDTLAVRVYSEDDARALCELHAALMAKLASAEVTA